MKRSLRSLSRGVIGLAVVLSALLFLLFLEPAEVRLLLRAYGFVSLFFLYGALFVGPVAAIFPHLPVVPVLQHSQKGLAISALLFAVLHVLLAVFAGSQIGGLSHLSFVSSLLGGAGLVAIGVFAVRVPSLGAYQRYLSPVGTLAGWLVLLHGLTATLHLIEFKLLLAVIYVLVLALGGLESWRLDLVLPPRFRAAYAMAMAVGYPLVAAALFALFF